jgi:hypothetical protein
MDPVLGLDLKLIVESGGLKVVLNMIQMPCQELQGITTSRNSNKTIIMYLINAA